MPVSTKKRFHSARANLMVIIGSALYFLILILVLYVMDRQVYTAGKMEIIRNNFLEIFHPPDTLNDQARRSLYTLPLTRRVIEQERLREQLESIVNGPTSMYSLSLVDEKGRVVVEASNPEKRRRMNTWENNLFIRDFSGRTSQNVSPLRVTSGETTATGHLTGTYTSPVGVPEITRLTQRYRVYVALIILGWVLAWLVIYYYLLRPVRNVTLHLDQSRLGVPSLIPNPRGLLETGYNDLAASALLQMLEEKMNRAARPEHSRGPHSRAQAVESALALAGEAFSASSLRIGLLSNDDTISPVIETHHWIAADVGARPHYPPLAIPSDPDNVHIMAHPNGTGFTWHGPLAQGVLQVDCLYLQERRPGQEIYHYMVRACDSFRSGFVAFQAYREQLFRERSEANISLSRNMGHDLTNIIATSKLELMGIKSILGSWEPGQVLPEQRSTILAQSVTGLLESTRFMQEMVNIYRSFSYVKRPAYERRHLPPLIEEFLRHFQPALSSHVQIEADLGDMPAPIVEPRLLKLALFNVLQNSLDALKRAADVEPGQGRITVRARYTPQNGHYEIAIGDNGPGICDEEGVKLRPEQVQAIFDYGYSTKGESGEGLGLNWVQTIMTDFHDGGVRGENLPDGGAQIILWLKSMERKEARVGNGRGQTQSL